MKFPFPEQSALDTVGLFDERDLVKWLIMGIVNCTTSELPCLIMRPARKKSEAVDTSH